MTFREYQKTLNPEIQEYFKTLSSVFPRFLIPYIESKTMQRLRGVSYFCGMEFGSKEVYDFKYYVSRLDHSISTALIVWNFTYDETKTIAALFHDASTPTFSHVIDYMNGDSLHQESTEIDLKEYLSSDQKLLTLFKANGIKLEDVANFKAYSLVDNERPRLCADRLDSLFLANLAWTKETTVPEIKKIYDNLVIKTNESGEEEFSFIDLIEADRAVELNDIINSKTHSESDFISMNLLAMMTKKIIDLGIIRYEDLFYLTDAVVFNLIINAARFDKELFTIYEKFVSLKNVKQEISTPIKNKNLDPLVLSKRYSTF